jgi:hypothetical protein
VIGLATDVLSELYLGRFKPLQVLLMRLLYNDSFSQQVSTYRVRLPGIKAMDRLTFSNTSRPGFSLGFTSSTSFEKSGG